MRSDGRGDDASIIGQARFIRVSPSGLAFLMDIEGEEKWIPKSCIHDDSELYDEKQVGEEGELVLKQWFAEKEGFI